LDAAPEMRPARWSRVIVTRPADEAAGWVRALCERGWPAVALPLIDIGPPRDPESLDALQRARADWPSFDALMFVSAAAVQHFFAGNSPWAESRPGHRTRFWAPGPGTARALADALARRGVEASRIDAPPADAAQFDSEHLWPVVRDQVREGLRLRVVRGASTGSDGTPQGGVAGSGREWLMARCRERGAWVEACVAYERRAPAWTALQREVALAASGPDSLWLFSSSEAIDHLHAALPSTDWSQAQALCTHRRIARTARAIGFGHVIDSRPALDDVLRALESARSLP
jgi:uroporphyrinogen-III synthase